MYLVIFRKQPKQKNRFYSLAESNVLVEEMKKNAPVWRVVEVENKTYSQDEIEAIIKNVEEGEYENN